MELEFLLNLAVQVPIVVLFAWFVIKRDKDYDATRTARDREWHKMIERVHQTSMEQMKDMTDAMERIATQLVRNTTTLLLHDATVRGINPETIGSSKDIFAQVLNGKRQTEQSRGENK